MKSERVLLATLYDTDSRLDHSCPIPLIVSDDWVDNPIKDAVEEVYGIEYLPVSHVRGRPFSVSRFVPRPDLKYVQVVRVRDVHGNLQRIETKIVGSWTIATSSVERRNLSIRNYGKRFARKTICF